MMSDQNVWLELGTRDIERIHAALLVLDDGAANILRCSLESSRNFFKDAGQSLEDLRAKLEVARSGEQCSE